MIERQILTRHRLIAVVAVLLGAIGWVCFTRLSISDLPDVENKTLLVSTDFDGASPEVMSESVAAPLEKEFLTVSGVKGISSRNFRGHSEILLTFDERLSLEACVQQTESAISAAEPYLPHELRARPAIKRTNPSEEPLLYITLRQQLANRPELQSLVDTLVIPRLAKIEGVSQVESHGGQRPALRVVLSPQKLLARQMTIEDVRTALLESNLVRPAGTVHTSTIDYTLNTNSQITEPSALEKLVIQRTKDTDIRLSDLGSVFLGVENERIGAWVNEQPVIVITVKRKIGVNAIEVAQATKAALLEMEAALPQGCRFDIIADRSVAIRSAVDDSLLTMVLASFMVCVVIYLFTFDAKGTIISAISIPISFLLTFIVMRIAGISLNCITVLALTMASGYVVDDSIVVVESIVKHSATRSSRAHAIVQSLAETWPTVVCMTVSLVAVFVPFLFSGGFLGAVLREFSIVLCCAVISSCLVSYYIVPVVALYLMRINLGWMEFPRANAVSKNLQARLFRTYRRVLVGSLRRGPLVLWALVGLTALTVVVYYALPKGFMPLFDSRQIYVGIEGRAGIEFSRFREQQGRLYQTVAKLPGVESVLLTVSGGSSVSTPNSGNMFINLRKGPDLPSTKEAIALLRRDLGGVPELKAYVRMATPFRFPEFQSKALYQLLILADDVDTLSEHAEGLVAELAQLRSISDVNCDFLTRSPMLKVTLDRDLAARAGVRGTDVYDSIYSAYGPRRIYDLYGDAKITPVFMEVEQSFSGPTDGLPSLLVRNRTGVPVPLASLCKFETGSSCLIVNHESSLPSASISFNLPHGSNLGNAVREIESVLAKPPYSALKHEFAGAAKAYIGTPMTMLYLISLSTIMVFVVLLWYYDSVTTSLVIISGLPAASFGAVAFLWLYDQELNLMGYIGIILLLGIVKKNAIMLLDRSTSFSKQGLNAVTAVFLAGRDRFRPIVMTSAAAIAGILPVYLGFTAGAEFRRTLGISVFGGLLVSQFLTLFITPVLWLCFQRMKRSYRAARRPGFPSPFATELSPTPLPARSRVD